MSPAKPSVISNNLSRAIKRTGEIAVKSILYHNGPHKKMHITVSRVRKLITAASIPERAESFLLDS